MMLRLRSTVLLGIALVWAGPLRAQTVRGRVVDAVTGEPVLLAYAALMVDEGTMVVASLANDRGFFELRAPREGDFLLYVARTGYETLIDGVFEVSTDGVLDVQVGLTPEPIELDPVEVETEAIRTPLEVEGFYDRALMGRGTFLIRDDIQRVAVDKITDAFRQVPMMLIDESRPLIGSHAVMQYPAIYLQRQGRRCSPTVYLDRHVVARGGDQPVRPDDFVTPNEVEAMEIYTRAGQIPLGFDELTDCGVVLIWTRRR